MRENKGDSKNRYRMNIYTANRLGLEINKNNRYRLSDSQKKEYFNLKMQAQPRRLFFDIETSQYEFRGFRVGYNLNIHYDDVVNNAKIICISYSWDGSDKIHKLKWDRNMCDKAMVSKFIKIMNKADELVAHNGDRFDLKWIRTRAAYHRIPMKHKYNTYDTLKKARKYFNFPNNKLDTIAKYLGVGSKVEHRGKKMWNEVQDNNKESLKEMVNYCDGDIIVLKDVYYALSSYVEPNIHVGVFNGNLKYSCPNCGNDHDIKHIGTTISKKGIESKDMECQCCGYNYNITNSSFKYFLIKDAV